jgi:hypothetical protein
MRSKEQKDLPPSGTGLNPTRSSLPLANVALKPACGNPKGREAGTVDLLAALFRVIAI